MLGGQVTPCIYWAVPTTSLWASCIQTLRTPWTRFFQNTRGQDNNATSGIIFKAEAMGVFDLQTQALSTRGEQRTMVPLYIPRACRKHQLQNSQTPSSLQPFSLCSFHLGKCIHIISNFWQRSSKTLTTESYTKTFLCHVIKYFPETDSSHSETATKPKCN